MLPRLGDGLDKAVAALRAFALVGRERIPDERYPSTSTETIRLHRLVRQVAAARRDGEAREDALRALVEAMSAVYPREAFDDPMSWPRARRLHALAFGLVGDADTPPKGAEEKCAYLLDWLGSYMHRALAAYAQARPLREHALAICEKTKGPDHPNTATSLSNLASLLEAQGDLAGARPLFERALVIYEKALGPGHPSANRTRRHLARLLLASGNPGEALALGEAALAGHEKLLGQDHPWTKDSAAVTADALDALGRAEETAALRARYGLAPDDQKQ